MAKWLTGLRYGAVIGSPVASVPTEPAKILPPPTYRISSRTNVTGPSKPEGSSGEFAL